MSGERLDLALREVADAAAAASRFGDPDAPATAATVGALTARVRRRRAVRRTAGGAVAAGVVGVAAAVGPLLTQDVAPAGDPDARPGECRSVVGDLPGDGGDLLRVDLGTDPVTGTALVGPPSADLELGTWGGGTASLVASVRQIPDAGVGDTRLRVLVTQGGVVLATADEDLSLEPASTHAQLLERTGQAPTGPDTDVYPLLGDTAWALPGRTAADEPRLAQGVRVPLTACDGSGPLAPGTYQVWVTTVDAYRTARGAAGPWDLRVTDAQAASHRLPAGFPRDVPLVDGELVAAHRHGRGWAAEVVTAVEDRADVAAELLARRAERGTSPDPGAVPLPPPYQDVLVTRDGIALPGWAVRAVASHTPDGRASVVYVLTPRR